jgi:TetR/AcrR family transcriptional regulator, cholesterol catabolism regulator
VPTETVSAARPLSRSQAARRQKIIDVALDMLKTRSHEQVQMRDISQAADLALGTVYRYFPSKELLLAYVFEEWCEGYWDRLGQAADGRANVDRLIELARRSVEAYENEPNILAMLTALGLSNDPAVTAILTEISRRAAQFFLNNLTDIDPADAAAVVDVLLTMVGSKLTLWTRGQISIEQVYESMDSTVRLLLEFRDPKK